MTITVDPPSNLERELTTEAELLGLSLSEYVVRSLESGRVTEPIPKTGAELVAYWQRERLIGTRPDIFDSQEVAREI